MEYWWKSSFAAAAKRSRISLGGSKSGNPCERFTAPYFKETLVIRRITESVKVFVRLESSGMSCTTC